MKSIVVFGFLLLGLALFLIERRPKEVGVYSVNNGQVAFHKSWPTYGLPMGEFEMILTRLRDDQKDQKQEAIDWLEIYLDKAVYDAKRRRQVLEGKELQMLDNALHRVVRYREKHPRPHTQSTNAFWKAEKQAEVDDFLRSFNGKQ